jgi:HSP20 family protein
MRPLTSMRSDFDRLFSDLEREFFSPAWAGRRPGDGQEIPATLFAPPINVIENEHEIIVEALVPGIKPEELSVEVENNFLRLSGESRKESEDKNKNYYRREIMEGRFYREVQLPTEVEGEKANARFEHGRLRVTIPKSQQTRRHKVQIAR